MVYIGLIEMLRKILKLIASLKPKTDDFLSLSSVACKRNGGLNDKERYPVYQFGTCDFHNFAFFSVYINYATNDTFRNDRSI